MLEPIQINDAVRVPGTALQMKAVRAGGPGGQNVNKVSSKVELRVDLGLIEGLAPDALERLRQLVRNQLDGEGRWMLTSSLTRDQSANLEDARAKVAKAVAASLAAPIPRRPTRPTHGSKLRRVTAKKLTGARKQARSAKDWD
ncbi:MAG: alternative ribosome rescue aminoacyl-tRNA hydrolase ArfB [Holophaga sp.]|nr:alternative ribosome rescue aminoacyl-tRNA hydrolase ArfB [Holophaga sp.]